MLHFFKTTSFSVHFDGKQAGFASFYCLKATIKMINFDYFYHRKFPYDILFHKKMANSIQKQPKTSCFFNKISPICYFIQIRICTPANYLCSKSWTISKITCVAFSIVSAATNSNLPCIFSPPAKILGVGKPI